MAIDSSPSLSERMVSALRRVTYRCVVDEDDREDIYRLRHDAYVREGAIEARGDGRFWDAVDYTPNTSLFGVYVDDELAGSIRLSVTRPRATELPTGAVFPEFVQPEIARGRLVVDPTRFVASHVQSRRVPELPHIILRLPWMAMEHLDADILLIAVRPEHQAFYRRLWGASVACGARTYPKLNKPVSLAMLDYAAARARVLARYPFFASTALERSAIFEGTGTAAFAIPNAEATHTDAASLTPRLQ